MAEVQRRILVENFEIVIVSEIRNIVNGKQWKHGTIETEASQ